MTAIQDFSLVAGDTFLKQLELTDTDGLALDLTGVTFSGTLKRGSTELAFTFTEVDYSTGLVNVGIAADDTTDLHGRYGYEFSWEYMTDEATPVEVAYTFMAGTFSVERQVNL